MNMALKVHCTENFIVKSVMSKVINIEINKNLHGKVFSDICLWVKLAHGHTLKEASGGAEVSCTNGSACLG